MEGRNKILKADWFDGTQAEWEQWIAPAAREGIVNAGNIGLYAVPEDVDDAGGVNDLFISIIRDGGWQERVGTVNSIFRSMTVRNAEELRKANILRMMARFTPRRSAYLFSEVIEREGFKDIKVPNLSSALVGAVPTVVAGSGAFGFVMEHVARNWYKGERSRMAADIGTDTAALDKIIRGQALPKTHAEVVKIAEGLKVDPDVLDIAWFADKKAMVVNWFAQKPEEESTSLVRAMIMNWLAAARLGRKFIPIGPEDCTMEKYLEQVVFALEARIHPRTVIPVIASIDNGNNDIFKNATAYAEKLAQGGWPWKAAILCYMAANDAEFRADVTTLTSSIHLGNNYLLNSKKALPEFMSPAHASELQHHYLQWGLDLHRSVAASTPEVTASVGYRQSVADELQDESASGFVGIVRSVEPDYGVKMTPSRRSVVEEFKENCPELWEEIKSSGRYDVVGHALDLADPHSNRSAVSFMAFNMAMRALSEGEGIIGKDFGKSMTNVEYIAEGAEVLFGGYKMRMYQGKLRPVLETHLGEEVISLGQGKDLIPVSMLAGLAATRVK
jgi:hypothetical protein